MDDEETPVDDEESTAELEDGEEVEDTDDSAVDGEDSSEDNVDGGSGAEGEEDSEEESDDAPTAVAPPTGKALLDLLAGDTDAQAIMQRTLTDMMAEQQRSAAAQAEAKEFQDLIEAGDHAEIGRRVLDRMTQTQTRSKVAEEVLRETFLPIYAELYAEPEMKNLTAEEKDALNPARAKSDAHYVRTLEQFIQAKRTNAAIEAEVTKRIKARDEAAGNRTVAEKARQRSISGSPSGTAMSGTGRDSRSMIATGLRSVFGVSTAESDDDD